MGELLPLIDALAVAEVSDYMTAQAASGNDSAPERSERPASGERAEAA